MTFYLSTTAKNACLSGTGLVSAAGATSSVKLYNGTAPLTADAALSGNTLLVSLPCSATLAPAAVGGVLTANLVTETNAVGTGNASFYRLIASDGTTVLGQGDCAVTGASMNMPNLSIAINQPVRVNTFTVSIA